MHYAEFQIDPGGSLTMTSGPNVCWPLCGCQRPPGPAFTRMYHGYDLRRFLLDTRICWAMHCSAITAA